MTSALFAMALLLPSFEPAPSREAAPPPAMQSARLDARPGARLPRDVRLVDSTGRFVDLARFLSSDTPVVFVLAYYRCPMLCGLNLRGLATALEDSGLVLGRDYRALTVSFDPRDGPDDAARIQAGILSRLRRMDAREQWPFAVGDARSIRALTDAVGFRYALDERTGQYAHPAVVFVLRSGGVVTQHLYGIDLSPRDVKVALEAPAGESASESFFDRVFMTCFRYDPSTRRYGPYLLGFMRVGAFFILLVAVGLGVHFLRLERRRQS